MRARRHNPKSSDHFGLNKKSIGKCLFVHCGHPHTTRASPSPPRDATTRPLEKIMGRVISVIVPSTASSRRLPGPTPPAPRLSHNWSRLSHNWSAHFCLSKSCDKSSCKGPEAKGMCRVCTMCVLERFSECFGARFTQKTHYTSRTSCVRE